MTERTFAMIKPHNVQAGNTGAIISSIEQQGFTVVALQKHHLSREQAEQLYAIHRERPFFNDMLADITAAPVILLCLEKDNAIKAWRDFMGATDPAQAAEGTLRKVYGKSIGENAVHGSDSDQSAKTELGIFFPTLVS